MRYAVGAAWLALAVLLRNRRGFAYAGCILAMVHVLALACGRLYQAMERPSSEPGVSAAGMLIGIALGVAAGVAIAPTAARVPALYWVMQAAAVAFLIWLPLVRF